MNRTTKLLFLLFLLSYQMTYSQKTWNGATGDWNTAANWSPSGVPTASDNVIINSGTVVVSTTTAVAASLTISTQLTINSGSKLALSGNSSITGKVIVNGTLSSVGNINVASTGELDILSTSSSATLLIGAGMTLTNSGTCKFIGTSSTYPAIVTRISSGNYSITQSASSASFYAKYYQFNYLSSLSISGGQIDATYNFSNGSFSNGTGTQYLSIENIDVSSLSAISSVIFNTGPTYNVTRTSGTGALRFTDATGALSGENFDNDDANPGTRILWTYPSKTYYSKANGKAGKLTDWTSNTDGTGSNPTSLTDSTASLIVQDGHTVTLDATNGNIKVKELQIGQGGSGATFVIGDDATQRILIITQRLSVMTNSVLKVGTFSSPYHFMRLNGNLYNLGTIKLNDGSNRVYTEILGSASSIQGNAPILGDLTIKNGANVTTQTDLNVNGTLIIRASSTLNDGGKTIIVGENWMEETTGKRTGSGTVEFNGSNTIQAIGTAGGIDFNNVVFRGAGVALVNDATTINGNLTVKDATSLNVGSVAFNLKSGFTVESGSSYVQLGDTTRINNSTAQSMQFDGSVIFNNLILGGSGTKTFSGALSINRIFWLQEAVTVDGNAAFTAIGGIRLDGTCSWTGTLSLGGGTIYSRNSSGTPSFGSVPITVTGYVYFNSSNYAFIAPGEVTVLNGGAIIMQNYTFLVGSKTNKLILNSGANLFIRDAEVFPANFTYSFNVNSNVYYDWVNEQDIIIKNVEYGNLILNDNGPSTATLISKNKNSRGNLIVKGNLFLYGGVTLNMRGYDLSVAGNIYNGTGAVLEASTSALNLNSADANQTVGIGTYNLKDLNISLSAGTASRTKYFTSSSTLNITGNLNITNDGGGSTVLLIVEMYDNVVSSSAGSFNLGAYCQLNTSTPDFGNNFIYKFASSKNLNSQSTIYYSLNGAQSIASGFSYGNVWISTTNNYTFPKTADGALDINGNFSVISGTPVFYDGGFTHTIAGNWGLDTVYYSNASSTGTIVFDGIDQTISRSYFNNLIIKNTGVATMNGLLKIKGDITLNSNSRLDAGAQAIRLWGNWITPDNGIFTQTTGTVYFQGATNQNLTTNTSSTFGSINIVKPYGAETQTLKLGSDLIVAGRIDITSNAGVFDISDHTLFIGSHFYIYGNSIVTTPTFISTNSKVVFNGSSQQLINNYNSNPLMFNNIEFVGSGTKFFGRDASPASNIVDVNGNFTINGSLVRGDGFNNSVNIYVAGNWENNGSYINGQTTFFDGNDQTISSSSFGSVDFTNTGTKTLTGNITATWNVTISASATLEPAGYNINLSGNWINSSTGSKFNNTSGTVIFEGASGVSITTGTTSGSWPITSGKGFYNLILNKNATATATMAGDIEVVNDLTLQSGTLTTSTYDMWVGGNYLNTGGIYNQSSNNSLLTLNSATDGAKTFDPGTNAIAVSFRGIRINGTSGTTYKVANNFAIQAQNFVLDAGTFNLNAHSIQVNSDNEKIQINGGTFDINAGSAINFVGSGDSIINYNGVLKVVGTAANIAILNQMGTPTTRFVLMQKNGVIHASNYKLNNTNGIKITGGSIDATNNLSDGTFASGAGNAYLTLTGLNFADFTVSNVVFNNGPTKNVSRTSGTGVITFADATGTLVGETYEQDNTSNTLINWTTTGGGYYWTGAVSDDWHTAGNWFNNTVPDATSVVYLTHKKQSASYTARIYNSDASAYRLIVDAEGGLAVALRIDNGHQLAIKGSVAINTNSSLIVTNASSIINVSGNWSNAGTYTPGSSTLIFDGANAYFTLFTGGNGVGKKFYNVKFSGSSAVYSLAGSMDADNNIEVTNGTLDMSSSAYSLNVGGNWNINVSGGAAYIPSLSTVTFDGANQSISGGPFYNLVFNGSGEKLLNSALLVNGNITLDSGSGLSFKTNDNPVYVYGNWTNNGGTLIQSSLANVTFCGTTSSSSQIIDRGSSSTVFVNIACSGASPKIFNRPTSINGNFTVYTGSGSIDVRKNQLTGSATSSFYMSDNTSLVVKGANNFPNFPNVVLSTLSTVQYYSDLNQVLKVSPNWSYGNLVLTDSSTTSPTTKVSQSGDLTIRGNLTVSGATVQLDMATNTANMVLTGTISFPTGGLQINWGTASSTLTHNGGRWYIDKDITGFNNLVLGGYEYKFMQGDLNITGNVIVKNGVRFMMREDWGPPPVPHVMHGLAGKTFTLENGSFLNNSTAATTEVAFPYGFGTYALGETSTTTLDGSVAQTIYTGNGIIYGNLNLGGTSRNVTLDGVANLDVNGYFDSYNGVLYDNGKNINVAGSYAYLNYYTPSSGVTFTLDGNITQNLYDTPAIGSADPSMDFANLVFTGYGTKNLGNGDDLINIAGNVTISSNVTVVSARNIYFRGTSWVNNGIFRHTGGTFTVDGTSDATIDPGPSNTLNYFNNMTFTNSLNRTFSGHGVDVNGLFTINSGTVNFGNYSHYLAGDLINTSGGVLNSSLASFNFDGGNQSINTPTFNANNISIKGTGTKRMFSNWVLSGDLQITNLTALNTCPLWPPTAAAAPYYDISLKGNWTNLGTFTSNTSKVTFNGASSTISITGNTSNFYDVDIVPTASVEYLLQSPYTRVSHAMTLGANGKLNLNSKILYLGSNISSGKTYTINGELYVNELSTLKINNQGSQSIMNVSGKLTILGTNSTNVATISRDQAASTASLESQINILSGGKISARYYLIEFLQDAGMVLKAGSTLDAVNNFSYGTWSNIRNSGGITARYLDIEAINYTGDSIRNICFNFAGQPSVGYHFNVRHTAASPIIKFAEVTGNLSSYKNEYDDQYSTTKYDDGSLRWRRPSSATWVGSISSDWHTVGNWQGGIMPNIGLDATIPKGSPYDPKITANDAECKNLSITSGRLTLDNGKKLTTAGDIYIGGTSSANFGILEVKSSTSAIVCGGYWVRQTYGSFAHGNGTVTFVSGAGAANITPLTSNFYNVIIDNSQTMFYLVGTPITIDGSVIVRNGTLASSSSTSNYAYNVGGDFLVESGYFNPNLGSVTGVVNLIGDTIQNLSNIRFYNLNVAGTKSKVCHDIVTIDGTTTISSTLIAETGSNIDFNGNVTILASGTFDDGGETHTFTGTSWTGTGAYAGAGTIVFDRSTGGQNIYASKFNNIEVKYESGNLNLLEDAVMTGDFTFRNNNLTGLNFVVGYNLLNCTSGTGVFTVEGPTGILINGTDHFPAGFSDYVLSSTSTTTYRGANDQLVAGVNYGNLNIQGGYTKTLKGDISVQTSLNINTSTTLDVSADDYSISLSGNWNNTSTSGIFVPRKAEVIFEGSTAAQSINVLSNSNNPFWDVTVNKSSGYVACANTSIYDISNNLQAINGTFNASNRRINIGGNLLATTGTFASNGSYVMTKSSGTGYIQTNSAIFSNIIINAGASATIQAIDNLRVDGPFVVQSGIFDGNGKRVVLGLSGHTVNIYGTYKVGAGGSLELGDLGALTVNSGGAIEVIGTASAAASVTRNVNAVLSRPYTFNVDGTIRAQYALFEWMGGTDKGIYVSPSGYIDPANNFSNCMFNNGVNNRAMLTIENTQSFTDDNMIYNVSFPVNPAGTGTSAKNVRKTEATSGTLDFYNSIGVFAGELYDDDPYNLINWKGPITLTWNGLISTDWYDVRNWTANSGPAFLPNNVTNTIIAPAPGAPYQPVITAEGANTAHFTVQNAASLIINSTDASTHDLQVNGDITIQGQLIELSTNDKLAVTENWIRSGTTQLDGKVTFNGDGGNQLINNGSFPFGDLDIAGTTLYKIGYGIVKNDLTIHSGAYLEAQTNAQSLYVGGSWLNQGTFTASNGKVTFNAATGTHTINQGNSAFNNIDMGSSANYQLAADLNLNNTINISGVFDLNGYSIYAGDNTGTDYLNINTDGTLTVSPNSFVRMGAGSNFEVNGILNMIGTNADNRAFVNRQTSGTYAFNVYSGATLAAKYYSVDYVNTNGVYLRSGANINPNYNLSEGIFSQGTSGGTYLKFENNYLTNDTLKNVVFNLGPKYNATRVSGTGIVFFRDASGPLSAYKYENDVSGPLPNTGLLQWSFKSTYVWTGQAYDRNWHTPGNWLTNVVPIDTNSAIIYETGYDPIISNADVKIKNLIIDVDAALDINGKNLTVTKDITNEGTISAIGSPEIKVGGNWNASTGYFNSDNSKVIFNAATGVNTIAIGTGDFYNLEINGATSAQYQLSAATTIRNNVSILSGTLDASLGDLTVGGSWLATGTFIAGGHLTTFNGAAGTYSIQNGTNSLYDCTIYGASSSATYRLASELKIANKFILQRGTLDLSPDGGTTSYNLSIGNRSNVKSGVLMGRSSTISVGENWQVVSPGVFTCGNSTVVLKAVSSTKSLIPGSSAFYNLTVNSGGTYRLSNFITVNNNLSINNGTLDVSTINPYSINLKGNWSNSGTFNAQTGLVVLNGTSQTISKAGGELFHNLSMQNATNLTLLSDVNIKGTLTMSAGTIQTGVNKLTLGNASTMGVLTYSTGTIVGNFERWISSAGSYIFPVGSSSYNNLATLKINSLGTAGSVITSFIPGDPGSNGLPLDDGVTKVTDIYTEGAWSTKAANGLVASNYDISLLANGFVSKTLNTNTKVIYRTASSANWEAKGTHEAVVGVTCARKAITAVLGQFGIANVSCNGGNISASQTICANSDVAPFGSLFPAYGYSNSISYAWEYTTNAAATAGDGINWNVISSSNSESFDYGNIGTASTRFVRKAIITGCPSTMYSNILTIDVLPVPLTGKVYRKVNQ